MALFKAGTTVETRESFVTVDAGLQPGVHHFQLVVVDDSGLASAPATLAINVLRLSIPVPVPTPVPTPVPRPLPIPGPIRPPEAEESRGVGERESGRRRVRKAASAEEQGGEAAEESGGEGATKKGRRRSTGKGKGAPGTDEK